MDIDKALTLLTDKLESWVSILIKMLPNLFLACLILVVGLFFVKKIRNFFKRKLTPLFPTKTLGSLLINLIYVFLIGIVLFITLRILNLDKTITTALAGAGIIGLALAFAFQDIAANFMSGIFLAFRKPFEVGEAIRISEYEGYVRDIRLRDTTIQTYQGQLVIIPNKDVFQHAIINFTRLGKRRADVTGGVSKADDLRKVREVALEALKNVHGAITEDTTFLFENIGESTIDFKVRIWVNSDQRIPYLTFVNDVIIALQIAFQQNGISLPNPIRTLDFGMKGGKDLSEMLTKN